MKCGRVTPRQCTNLKQMDIVNWICPLCSLSGLPFFNTTLNSSISSSLDSSITSSEPPGDEISSYKTNVLSYYKFNLSIAHININSIWNKIDEVKILLNEGLFDILAISETKLDSTYDNNSLQHPSYRILRKDRKKGGGGLLVYIRNGVSAYRRLKLEPPNMESICIDMKGHNNSRFLVLVCYRSPTKNKPADFLPSIYSTAESLFNIRNELLIIGDLNFNMLVDGNTEPDPHLSEFCDCFCMANTITEPTRVTNNSASLIDVILTSNPERFALSGTMKLGISDHDLIYTIRKQKIQRPPPKLIEYRSMKNLDRDKYLDELSKIPWDSAYIYDNVDDVCEHWYQLFTDVVDQHMPHKKKFTRGDQLPWITPEICNAISRRNILSRKFKKNRTQDNWVNYKKQRNIVTTLKRKSMKSYFIHASTDCSHPGEFWKKFKPLLPSKCAPPQNIQLLEEGRLITNNTEVANVFNKYFTDGVSAHIPNLCESTFVNHVSVNEIKQRHKNKHFSFSSVEVGYIKDLLVSLNPNKATGSDNISPRVLAVSSEALAVPVTNLINHCLAANAWPSLWKCSNVTPLFKKDSPADKTNYRPVSVLTSLSKIFERVQHDQMLVFSKSVLSDRLSGFLKGHSCTTALLKMTEDFRASLDIKEHCAAIAVDLSKAFDSVSHSLLLSKLRAYGFSDSALCLTRSYLCGRKQRVKIGNSFSDWNTIKHGVPQGSILGPLLFNLFINDLTYFVVDANLRLYADDTTQYLANRNPNALQSTSQNSVDVLQSWFECNYLSVNEAKTKVLSLGDGPTHLELFADRTKPPLDVVKDLKLLGLTIDSSLTYKAHVKSVCDKVNAKVAALRRVRKFIPADVMINVYKAFILPHLEYCAPVLVGLSSGLINKLESTNQFAIRTLMNLPKSTPYGDLLKIVNIKSLEHRRYTQALVLLYKSLFNTGPNYIKELFSLRSSNYNLRGFCKLNQPSFKSKYLHNSYCYITSRLWNNLPDNIRGASSLRIFKSLLNNVNLTAEANCRCNLCIA